jgi:hypothetical protein
LAIDIRPTRRLTSGEGFNFAPLNPLKFTRCPLAERSTSLRLCPALDLGVDHLFGLGDDLFLTLCHLLNRPLSLRRDGHGRRG